MKDRITVGYVSRPQGINGFVKIQPTSEDVAKFTTIKQFYVGDTLMCVKEASVRSQGVFLLFENVNSRDGAELLRGRELSVERSALGELPRGQYYVADLLGLNVAVGERSLGVLDDVQNFGASDVFYIKTAEGKLVLLPCIKGTIVSVDFEAAIIRIDEKLFSEMAVTDDEN